MLGLLLLPSCGEMQQGVDLGWFGDVISSPENDVVDVEEGSGLPETAVAAATTSAPVLPAPPEPALATVPTATEVVPTPAPVAAAPVVQQPVQVAAPVVQQAATAAQTYTISKGDTLNAIAARCKCSPQALATANGITDPRKLKIGQVLTIPGTGAMPAVAATGTPAAEPKKQSSWKFWKQNAPTASGAEYIVQKGDTLSTIARRHGTTLQALLSANGMTMQQANALRIGQRIALPAAK